MWNLMGTFIERQLAHALYSIFCPFFNSAAWNLDVMAGTLDTILNIEDRATLKNLEEPTFLKIFVEQGLHINSGLPTSTHLCEKIKLSCLSQYYFGPLLLSDEPNPNWFTWNLVKKMEGIVFKRI